MAASAAAGVGSAPMYTPPVGVTGTFEAQLSDLEGNTDFKDVDRVYPFTNEFGSFAACEALRAHDSVGDTILGVSGFQIFACYLARQEKGVQHVISIDPGPQYVPFWKFVSQAITACSTKEEFSERLFDELLKNWDIYFKPMQEEDDKAGYLEGERRAFNQLFDADDKFQAIKDLFREKRFFYLPIDLGQDSGSCKRLMDRLVETGHSVDTIYTSNVEEILSKQTCGHVDQSALQKNIAALTDAFGKSGDPIHVDAAYRQPKLSGSELNLTTVFASQRINKKAIDTEKTDTWGYNLMLTFSIQSI